MMMTMRGGDMRKIGCDHTIMYPAFGTHHKLRSISENKHSLSGIHLNKLTEWPE